MCQHRNGCGAQVPYFNTPWLSTVDLSSGQEVCYIPEYAGILTVKNLMEERPRGSLHNARRSLAMGILWFGWVGTIHAERNRVFLISINRLFVSVTWKNWLTRRKDWFWLMVSEASIHGHLAPCSGTCGEVEHSGREHMGEQSWSPPDGHGAAIALMTKLVPPPIKLWIHKWID